MSIAPKTPSMRMNNRMIRLGRVAVQMTEMLQCTDHSIGESGNPVAESAWDFDLPNRFPCDSNTIGQIEKHRLHEVTWSDMTSPRDPESSKTDHLINAYRVRCAQGGDLGYARDLYSAVGMLILSRVRNVGWKGFEELSEAYWVNGAC